VVSRGPLAHFDCILESLRYCVSGAAATFRRRRYGKGVRSTTSRRGARTERDASTKQLGQLGRKQHKRGHHFASAVNWATRSHPLSEQRSGGSFSLSTDSHRVLVVGQCDTAPVTLLAGLEHKRGQVYIRTIALRHSKVGGGDSARPGSRWAF
jgi:hypothetical protein